MAETDTPKKRVGCLRIAAKWGVVLVAILVPYVYWNFVRIRPLKISKETTYFTQPLTRDGKCVDYFAAVEQVLYPHQMKTDDNGYRLIVRALGEVRDDRMKSRPSKQICEKLGLDPGMTPTASYVEPYSFLCRYCETMGLTTEQTSELDAKSQRPWTLKDLPMMQSWLQQNGPVLDVVSVAVRRPTFCIPLVRPNEQATLFEENALWQFQRTRSLARGLSCRAWYRIGTGNVDGAIDDVIACARLGRRLESQGILLACLQGTAISGIACAVGIAGEKSQPSKGQLRRLREELDAIPPHPSMERSLLTTRLETLNFMQGMASRGASLAELLSVWDDSKRHTPTIAAYVSVDWNIAMSRVNAQWGNWENGRVSTPEWPLSLQCFWSSWRSRSAADRVVDSCDSTFKAVREMIGRSDCVDHLRRIALAMLMYEREHGTLPPAYTVDGNGRPLHSWRVLLLPYLGENDLFGKLRLDEPWDSQHNRQFHDVAVPIYQCPSAALNPGQTTYSVIVGEKTAFRGGQGKSLTNLGANMILVVERELTTSAGKSERTVCWMDPMSELSQSVAFAGINRRNPTVNGVGSPHPGGVNAAMRDGSARFISQMTELSLFQALLEGTAKELPD